MSLLLMAPTWRGRGVSSGGGGSTPGDPVAGYAYSDDFTTNYANTAALRAALRQTTPSTDSDTGQFYNDCDYAANLLIATNPVSGGETNAKIQILDNTTSSNSEPQTRKSNMTAMSNASLYFEQAYAAGFTPVGAGAVGQGYKIAFVTFGNASGRVTLEWANSQYTFGGTWTNSGAGNAGVATSNEDFNAPYTVSGGIWSTPQYVCVLIDSEAVSADYMKFTFWTWLKGGTVPAYPTRVHYCKRASGSLPTINGLVMGANYNQTGSNRTAAPTAIYWRKWLLYNRDTVADPCSLNSSTVSIALSASSLTVARGGSTTVDVTITRGGYTGTITPSIHPDVTISGVSLSNTPAMTTGVSTTTITISATGGASVGTRSDFSLAFSGIGGRFQIPITVT